MIKLYRARFSTNVERVALALAHKGLSAEPVWIEYSDRSPVEQVSGQGLVPVIDYDGQVVADSMEIVRYLEQRHPDPPLFPADPARRAEMLVFVDWFNRVWKRPPNELVELAPGAGRAPALAAELRGSLALFEALLAGREYLLGAFSVADCTAFPFLKYGLLHDPADEEPFHRILIEHLRVEGAYPRLEAWIRRVDAHPRA